MSINIYTKNKFFSWALACKLLSRNEEMPEGVGFEPTKPVRVAAYKAVARASVLPLR